MTPNFIDELAEAATDPLLNGWNSGGVSNEVADLCPSDVAVFFGNLLQFEFVSKIGIGQMTMLADGMNVGDRKNHFSTDLSHVLLFFIS